MTAIEIARRMAILGQEADACKAYELALQQTSVSEEKMESALYLLEFGGNYKVSYTVLLSLYQQDCFREECLHILTEAFYKPNLKIQKKRYEKNCRLLKNYPYLFRKDFPAFADLSIRFYPFDDNGYMPFYHKTQRFGSYIKPKDTIISRNFFKDLEKPVFAQDVYSQYELEYLRDNVRRSEDVAMENHIYLAYSDWNEFCAYLQVLNIRPLLEDRKLVFLIEDEAEQYPIDFKKRWGIDYSTYSLQPVGIWEFNRLIWHTQLATHNGGDFFNEIFDGHPNLLSAPSLLFSNVEECIDTARSKLREAKNLEEAHEKLPYIPMDVLKGLRQRGTYSDKELLLVIFFYRDGHSDSTAWNARIVPALFFQPHFTNLNYKIRADGQGRVMLYSEQYEEIKKSRIFRDFKYIKTFTPMRRITTSYGATMRFLLWKDMQETLLTNQEDEGDSGIYNVPDELTNRLLNQSFRIDPEDRLYHDSVLVRFEDGKLNPKATFSALAAFLDLPYTESMTYCSLNGERDPESLKGNDLGFSTAAIYRTYDDYANDEERCFLEYFLQDAYQYYGYDFHYYDGGCMDEEKIRGLIERFTTLNNFIRENRKTIFREMKISQNNQEVAPEMQESIRSKFLEDIMQLYHENRIAIAKLLMNKPHFVNKNGQPLRMMPKLELDSALLEQPLYH